LKTVPIKGKCLDKKKIEEIEDYFIAWVRSRRLYSDSVFVHDFCSWFHEILNEEEGDGFGLMLDNNDDYINDNADGIHIHGSTSDATRIDSSSNLLVPNYDTTGDIDQCLTFSSNVMAKSLAHECMSLEHKHIYAKMHIIMRREITKLSHANLLHISSTRSKSFSYQDMFTIMDKVLRSKYVFICHPNEISIEKLEAMLVNWIMDRPVPISSCALTINDVIEWMIEMSKRDKFRFNFECDITLNHVEDTWSSNESNDDSPKHHCIVS